MNKPTADFLKGKQNRVTGVDYLNSFLEHRGACIHRRQEILKPMIGWEKPKNAISINMLQKASGDHAMGLDYMLTSKNRLEIGTPIVFIIKNKGGIYRKVPREFKNDPDMYMKTLMLMNYYIIVVDLKRMAFSYPIPISTAYHNWTWKMQTSKGNRNRLQFYGPVSSIETVPPEFPSLEGTVLDKLIELANKL